MTAWSKPTDSTVITSPFGPRKAPTDSNSTGSTNHKGVDFRAPSGAPIYAVGDGTVVVCVTQYTVNKGRGRYLQLLHGDGSRTLYQHLSRVDVAKGDSVSAGQVIGASGETGNTTGPHLHLEAINPASGNPVDPIPFLAARGVEPWASASPAPQPAPQPSSRVLRWGSTGSKVKELQRVLNAWYPRRRALIVDGIYGTNTERFVRYAQGRMGIGVDGIAGPITLGRLSIK